jgi:hypothetical protein
MIHLLYVLVCNKSKGEQETTGKLNNLFHQIGERSSTGRLYVLNRFLKQHHIAIFRFEID